jgi:hypothetical protein
MPFIPELFSFPGLARIEERRHERLTAVPFFDGLMTGEIDALIGSFAGEPEVHQPVSGRIRGASAFARFVSDTTGWMAERGVSVEDVDSILTPSRALRSSCCTSPATAARSNCRWRSPPTSTHRAA